MPYCGMWQRYRWPIVLGAASVVSITFSLILLVSSARPSAPIEFSSPAGSGQVPMLTVDVAGAVAHPGVYELAVGSRVADAIATAGGFTRDADAEAISRTMNRAAKLSDGAKLYIPQLQPQGSDDAQPQGLKGTVSLNAASQNELEGLSGVGPVTAQKIIAGRPYAKIEEVVSKKAMSQSLFDKLKDELTL